MGKHKCVFIVFIYSDEKYTQADGMQVAQHKQKPQSSNHVLGRQTDKQTDKMMSGQKQV